MSQISRRRFIAALTGAAASAALIEFAGAPRIFLPPRGGWPTSITSIVSPYQQQVSEMMRRYLDSFDVGAYDMLLEGHFVKVDWDGECAVARVIHREDVYL